MSQIPHEFAGPCPNERLSSLSPFDSMWLVTRTPQRRTGTRSGARAQRRRRDRS